MSDNQNYYYLKLKDDFFDSDEIKVLESMENGYIYSNILLKMYLKSIKRNGLLVFNERIPYNPKMISTVTNHNINDVKQALVLFQEMGLMEILSNGAIYMLDIQNFIGKSSTEADRIREYRNNVAQKKKELLYGVQPLEISDCTNVQQMNDISTPEIEIELELEPEIEPIYSEVVEYLNLKTGKRFKADTPITKRLIKARQGEGFVFEDFKVVIDVKVNEWKSQKDMKQYLRPQTLFGNKFEAYLNQGDGSLKKPIQPIERKIEYRDSI